jgi:hypothetical protein
MDIKEFYDADQRRRDSAEIEYGRDWHDAAGARYEISWIEDTGELYAMREPVVGGAILDPFGDAYSPWVSAESVTVRILAHVPDRRHVEEVLTGWEEAMPGSDSTRWVADRLVAAGIALEGTAESGPPY